METADQEGDMPAIRALGSLFKLTEGFLWDEGSKEIRRDSSLPKHIIFKYDDDDDVNEDDSHDGVIKNVDVHGNPDGEAPDDCALLEEDMDLAQQMSALGLPLSFQNSKVKKSRTTKGKRKDTGIMGSCIWKKDGILESGQLSEKENNIDEGFNNNQSIHHNGMAFEEHMCDESSPDLPNNDGTAAEDFCSSITIEQPQSPVVAESSDIFVYKEEGSCYCTGSFGDWRAIWDSYYMRNYFYNALTHESTWYPPPGMEHLALSNLSNESNADIVRADPDPAISSNESEVTFKSSEVECGSAGKLLDQLEHDAERLSSGLGVSAPHSFTVDANESQVLDEDCFDPSQPCSSLVPEEILDLDDTTRKMCRNGICDREIACNKYAGGETAQIPKTGRLTYAVTEATYDELLFIQVDEEGMDNVGGNIDNEDIAVATKRKKKARKSRSKKKSPKNNQEQLFQCTVDAYYSGIGKYWCQRYLLFSKFDQGIKMDEEGWFSVTPESIARHQASRCGSGVIVDCFAGVGGNAIQFARMGSHVIAIDIDPNKIEFAKHNATVYGVEGQIDFVIGDSCSLASKLEADTVFMSPPWGGPEYSKVQTYDMAMLKPHGGQILFNTFKENSSMIVMFLPRNVDLNQLAELCLSAGPQWSLEVEKNFLNGKLKAVTAYFCKASV